MEIEGKTVEKGQTVWCMVETPSTRSWKKGVVTAVFEHAHQAAVKVDYAVTQKTRKHRWFSAEAITFKSQ